MILLTQLGTNKQIAISPTHFIFHQPRKTRISLPGKPAFPHTTIMSTFSPTFIEPVAEKYEYIRTRLPASFAELTHNETGTKFSFSSDFFELQDVGCKFIGSPDINQTAVLISVFNPLLWVPIKETFGEACVIMGL